MDLTYEDVVRILTIVDTARGEDVTFDIGGRRITLISWREQPVVSPAATRVLSTERAAAATRPANLVGVRSTELGYFRRLPKLEVGAWAREGDTLGEIVGLPATPARPVSAPVAGRIVDLCVDEDAFVEYGQVLLVLDVAATVSANEPPREASDRRAHIGRATANQ